MVYGRYIKIYQDISYRIHSLLLYYPYYPIASHLKHRRNSIPWEKLRYASQQKSGSGNTNSRPKTRNISQKGVQSTVNKKNQKKLFVKPDQNPVRCSKAICFCTPTFLQDVVVKDVEYLHIRIAGPHVVVPSALHPVHQRRPAEAMKMDTLW